MSTITDMIISTNKINKILSGIAILSIMALIIYMRNNTQVNNRILLIYYLSFLFPFFTVIVISSILFELKRGYAIKLEIKGIWIGFFSIEFFIPWEAINTIELQDRIINRWPLTIKYQTIKELVITYNHEKRKFSRKINILDYLFDLVQPFLRNDLHISNKMINSQSNSIISYYKEINSRNN